MAKKEKFSQKLLVEGKNDYHVLLAICEKFKLFESFDIIDCEAVTELIKQIPIRLKTSDISSIGIVLDADFDLDNRWISLKNTLEKTNFNYIIPDSPNKKGTILRSPDSPNVGVWVMPNNEISGMVEDFLNILIPENDDLLPIVEDTLDSIESQNKNKYSSVHKSKAKIHTWLSWQEKPGTPMGLAITNSYFDTNKELCLDFVKWLNDLFNPNN